MPRLGPQERIWSTSSEVPRAWEDGKDGGSPAESRAQPGARTHLAVLAVPRLSGADGWESPTAHRCRRPTPKRQLPWGKQQNKVCIRLLGRVKKELVKNGWFPTFTWRLHGGLSRRLLLKNLMNSITFSIRDNATTRHKIPKALASG